MFARVLSTKRALKKAFRRFGRARRGSAALEFAFVIIPFFLLTFGLAEVAMIGLAQNSLDFGVSEAARQIRTGQAQLGGMDEGDIYDRVCGEMNSFVVVACDNNLFLDIRRFDSFVDANNAANEPIENGEFNTAGFDYDPGVSSDIVVVRVYYRWEILTPLFEPFFQNVNGGERILVSTMMFRNEPF